MFLRISCKRTVATEKIDENSNTQEKDREKDGEKDEEKDEETSISTDIPVKPGSSWFVLIRRTIDSFPAFYLIFIIL